MSSESGKLSPEELRARERQARQAAESVVPCVTVTEQNWKGLLALEQLHADLLTELIARNDSLATQEHLDKSMGWLTQYLHSYTTETTDRTESYQKKLKAEAEAFTSAAQTAVSVLLKQAGNVSEKFSSGLQEERKAMRRFQRKLFWISLLPTAITLLSLLGWTLWLR